METRNSKVLTDFIAYSILHPDERFWQALLNWSGKNFIVFSDRPPAYIKASDKDTGCYVSLVDTFYLEGKNDVLKAV